MVVDIVEYQLLTSIKVAYRTESEVQRVRLKIMSAEASNSKVLGFEFQN
jgi:hypothetical protein